MAKSCGIRQKYNLTARMFAKVLQALKCIGKCGDAVMHDAPKIEEKKIIVIGSFGQPLQNLDAHGKLSKMWWDHLNDTQLMAFFQKLWPLL